MSSRFLTAFLAISICLVLLSTAYAGLVFEDILNTMQIDQSLIRSGDNIKAVTRNKPLGQTFITGDSVSQVCRITLGVAYWNADWQVDETLSLTLWDSPAKKTSLGKFDIPYARRQWDEGITMFSVEARVEPKKQYYFELTVEGGNGKISGILMAKAAVDYTGGQAYEAGQPKDYDIWFETYVKKTYDRNKLYTEFFDSFNLDHLGMEKVKAAVITKDWKTACREFLAYFEARRDIFPEDLAAPRPDPTVDTTEADLVADQKWPSIDGSIADLGPNWNYSATWPSYGGVGLTRTGLMKPLAFTYTKTGNEKYARAWNDMLISFFRNVPCPLKSGVIKGEEKIKATLPTGISGGGGMWASISLAARMHHETFYNRFRKTPLFEQDTRMAWWLNLLEMANTLERMRAGGNWETQNKSALFEFARKYPEFKKSKVWFSDGFDGIKKNFIDNMYADGPCKEATTGYHGFSLMMFFDTFKLAKTLGLDVPKEYMDLIEKSFEYNMYITQPDWMTPIWGDSNRPMDASGLIGGGAEYFNRADMLWVATKGKEGKKPARTSIDFPIAGYFVMRSGWEPDARYLMTHNGYSASHGHTDQLSVIVNAYGTDLLPDMGIYNYGTPECDLYLWHTPAHSTICVDDKDLVKGKDYNTWSTLPGFDYFDGKSLGYVDLAEVKHQRSIAFVKPDYWVVADRVTGPGEHTVNQYWHFAPGKIDFDAAGIAKTTNTKGGNIAVIPLYPQSRKDEMITGMYAIDHTKIVKDVPVANYKKIGALPVKYCTVLFPYPAGKPADVKAEELVCSDKSLGIEVMGACIKTPASVDYIAFNTAGKPVDLNPGEIKTDAQSAVIRTSPETEKITAFSWHGGTSLSIGKTLLASSNTPVQALDVTYSKDTIRINSVQPTSTLSIATFGVKQAIVNGKTVKLVKDAKTFKPF